VTRTDVDVEPTSSATHQGSLEVIAPRDVPLGGLRAMTVRRTLPHRTRSTIGAWCFLDHYGPDQVASTGGMSVAPHPHIGLQTVSWLFSGEIEHRDSTGSVATIRPGHLNLMTAGRGIAHSEVSTGTQPALHGVQLWVALPDAARHQMPHFSHHESRRARVGDGVVTLFLGSLTGVGLVRAPTYSRLLGAQIDLPAGGSMILEVSPSFEHGVLVDTGQVTLQGGVIDTHHLGVLNAGPTRLTLSAGDQPVRAVLLGGEPLHEPLVMWWNFVGRSHEDIIQARADWEAHRQGEGTRFGHLDHLPSLPAPELPTVRLRSRL
jgi:quercetin 2,3-dioxygenase